MIGLGTIVNVGAIIAGSLLGLAIGHKLPERIHNLLIKALGLITIGIGIKMFFETKYILVVISSIIVGSIIGELLNIEKHLESFGRKIKSIIKSDRETFLDGFVTASLIYCVGPIAILGSLSDGMSGQHDILFTKSILDGVASIGFATSLGIGVLFSFFPVLLYQGAITILALLLGQFFSSAMITELTGTGGLLIVGIGINLVRMLRQDKRLPVGNMLPAIIIAPLIVWACQLTGIIQ